MPEAFSEARAIADGVRYAEDVVGSTPLDPSEVDYARMWGQLDQTGVEITSALLPSLEETLSACHSRLGLERSAVRAYVYASSEMQAFCLPLGRDVCAIRLSSELVERLEPNELAFVIGHEFGHYLLNHTSLEFAGGNSLEAHAISRAREVSCDRIGLLACRNIEDATRAIIKTVSGLGQDHIRFDVAEFLRSGLKNSAQVFDYSQAYASHPPMHARARMLLWFSQYLDQHWEDRNSSRAREAFSTMDRRVAQDMRQYVEHTTLTLLQDLKSEASRWIWLAAAVSDGKLSEAEQNDLKDRFGSDFVVKALRNLKGMSANDVREFVEERARTEIAALRKASPLKSGSYIAKEVSESNRAFAGSAFR